MARFAVRYRHFHDAERRPPDLQRAANLKTMKVCARGDRPLMERFAAFPEMPEHHYSAASFRRVMRSALPPRRPMTLAQ